MVNFDLSNGIEWYIVLPQVDVSMLQLALCDFHNYVPVNSGKFLPGNRFLLTDPFFSPWIHYRIEPTVSRSFVDKRFIIYLSTLV